MSFSAFNRVALRTGVALQPYRIDLYAANGKTMKTFGIAERVRFQLGGYELETNLKSEIKYLGRVVSAEGIRPDPKAVTKLRDWEVPRNKIEMQSFLGFANCYGEFIPWHAKLVAPLHAITGLGATFAWGDEQQQAFNAVKLALIEANALAQPDSEGEFVLDTDANAVAISGILHQWQGPPGEKRLRPIVYGSKKLNATQAKYGAPKLEMYAAYYFILKNHSYLCSRKFILRVDNQALSWLKTYSTDQALIGRWVMALEKYHFKVEHRRRTQHRKADGLSKRTNDYRWREKQLEKLPAVTDKWSFLSQEEFDQLPVAPWFDLHGRVIPKQPRDPGRTETVPYLCLQSDQVPGSPKAPQHESPPLARWSARLPMPAASVHTAPEYRQTATLEQSARCLQSACARRKLVVHRPEHFLDPHSESQQGAAAAVPAPAVPVKSCTTEMSAGCPTFSIQSETSSPRAEEKKKTDATQTLSTASGRVLMLRPADQATVNAPLTVTCGTKQVQTSLESTTFDPSGRTLLSVHLVLASEQQRRPDLTLEKLKLELASNSAVKKISLPLPKEWYTEGEASTCTAYTPVPVHANIDGVDMKSDASVVVDVFPQGVCLGPHELRC